jgi:hypothetical protein
MISGPNPIPPRAPGPDRRSATGPLPRAGTGPLPRVDTGPLPRVGTGPLPRVGTGPLPRVGTGPIPRVGTGPIPRVGTGPIPRAETGPIPRIPAGPRPPASTGPIPRASTGPIPRASTGPIPRVGTGPISRAETGPIPRIPAVPNPPGPPPERPPATSSPGYEFEAGRARHAAAPAGARRFRFTPTVSAGPPPQQWPEDRPGFEFDGAFPAARRPRARAALTRAATATQESRADQAATPGTGTSKPQPAERSEWSKLVRSFLPQPEKPRLARLFLDNLSFRGWVLRVGVPILTMVAVGIAVVVVVGAHSGATGPAPGTTALGFPPATLAGHDFTAPVSTRGLTQSLGRVASDGSEVVAVGSETGARIPRAQFFFSTNGGGSWSLATESAAGGGPPPPGHAARLIAGGRGNWVAVGPDSIWVSGTGQTWKLVSTKGLPPQVTVLRRISGGFMAAGPDMLFFSATGINWQRITGPAGALDIKFLAAAGNAVLLAGEVQQRQTIKGHPAIATVGAAWLSRDQGRGWTPVSVPLGHGAQNQIAGVATYGTGFVAIRPATRTGQAIADVYRSANGVTWAFAATLAAPGGFVPGVINGGPAGAVVTGQANTALTAFVSVGAQGAGATRWRQTRALGHGTAETVSGATVTPAGGVVTTAPNGASRAAPLIQVFSVGIVPRSVSLTAIPGAVVPQVAVNAVAAAGSAQVAVGSANGYLAAWMSTTGGSTWSQATGQNPTVLDRPGQQQLTSVTDGSAGWLAVGGVKSGAPQHPVVIVSADGSTWAAADNEPAFSQGGLFTEQAAAGAKGYVVVGYQRTAAGRMIAAAWWSASLQGWQRATDATPGALDGAGNRQMLAVTAANTSNSFVAVGLFGNQPAAWTSADGRQWKGISLPLPPGATRAVLLHVAAAGRTVVAAGMEQSGSGGLLPFTARSADGGVTWTETQLPVPSGVAQVTALAAAGGMFTATGTFGTTPGHQDVVVWTSPDGLTWKATTPGGQGLAGPGIQAITGLTVSGSTLTGVGFTASAASEQPLFWQSPIRS